MKRQLLQVLIVLTIATALVPMARATLILNQVVAQADLSFLVTNPTTELGFSFTVGASSFQINALGFLDLNNSGPATPLTHDGLIGPETVTLWTDGGNVVNGGTLLGTVTVPAGTAGILGGVWRYGFLPSPLTLNAGSSYRIVEASPNGDPMRSNEGIPEPAHDTPGAGITFNSSVFNFSVGYPQQSGGGTAYGLPNAAFILPEPSTVMLLGVGGLLLRIRRRRS